MLLRESSQNLEQRQKQLFPNWFKSRVRLLYDQGSSMVNIELLALAEGPILRTIQYTGCILNGVKWLVKHIDRNRTTQNSGVMTPGSHDGEDCCFYGSLTSVVKVQFMRGYKVFLFKCLWYNTNIKGKKVVQNYHLKSVNINTHWYDNDPYVLATQANQVFYLDDPKLGHPWKVVQRIQPRHVWNVLEKDENVHEDDNVDDNEDDDDNGFFWMVEDDNEIGISLCRDDTEPESIDAANVNIEQTKADEEIIIDEDNLEDELSSGVDEDNLHSDSDSNLE